MQTDTKEKILEEAYRLIHKNGFRSTSVDAIAKASGVKKANVFYYFPNKEALGLELLERVSTLALDKVLSPPLAGESHPTERIREHLKFARTHMEQASCEGGCPLGNLALEMADVDETFRKRLARFFEEWQTMLEGVLRRGVETGVYRDAMDPPCLAEFIVSSIEGAILMAKTTRKTEALENAENQLVALLESYHA